MSPEPTRNERTTLAATILGGVAVAVATTSSVAAAFFTGIVTSALGVLLGTGALELLKGALGSLF